MTDFSNTTAEYFQRMIYLSQLAQTLMEGPSQSVVLEVISAGVSDSADPVVVTIQASP